MVGKIAKGDFVRMPKRSIIIDGKNTSISAEKLFWDYLISFAWKERISIGELAARIRADFPNCNLSSALRCFALQNAMITGPLPPVPTREPKPTRRSRLSKLAPSPGRAEKRRLRLESDEKRRKRLERLAAKPKPRRLITWSERLAVAALNRNERSANDQ